MDIDKNQREEEREFFNKTYVPKAGDVIKYPDYKVPMLVVENTHGGLGLISLHRYKIVRTSLVRKEGILFLYTMREEHEERLKEIK